MAINSQAGAIAGMQAPVPFAKPSSAAPVLGAPQSLFLLGGNPLAGSPNTGLTGANYSSSSAVPAGILYHKDPPSGNAYLGRWQLTSSQAGGFLLLDRLWDCGPATASTSAQTITQPTLPARDAAGATNGLGVMLGIEVVTAVSSTAAVVSVSYTNSAGTSGRTAGFVDLPTAATTSIGRFFRIGLQAGDLGVQSVQSVTFSTDWTSGTIALVAYRLLAVLSIAAPNGTNQVDAVSAGFPQLYNGTCAFMVGILDNTVGVTVAGIYQETQG